MVFFLLVYIITPQYYSKLQKNPRLYDFPLRIFLKAHSASVNSPFKCRLPLVNVDYLPQVSTTPNKLTTPPCVDYPQMW